MINRLDARALELLDRLNEIEENPSAATDEEYTRLENELLANRSYRKCFRNPCQTHIDMVPDLIEQDGPQDLQTADGVRLLVAEAQMVADGAWELTTVDGVVFAFDDDEVFDFARELVANQA